MGEDDRSLRFTSGRVKRLRALLRARAERAETGLLVVEGTRAIEEAFDAGATVEALYAAPEASRRCPGLLERAAEAGVVVEWLAEGVAERVSDTVTPQPLFAVAASPVIDLRSLAADDLLVVLVGVREPGNAGTLVRSAEAAGASAVVFCRGSVDPSAPKVVRAAAGALFHLPVVRGEDPREVLDVLAERGVRRLATSARSGEAYDLVDWGERSALVLGNEARGLPAELDEALDGWVTIPHEGRSGSINVAMAGSVVLFEAARQRRHRCR